MRSSLTVAAILMLLLLLSTAQGIHFERQNHRSSHKNFHLSVELKASLTTKGSGAGLVVCRENRHCSPGNAGGVDQRIPRIHEDYYGPGDHKSKHH